MQLFRRKLAKILQKLFLGKNCVYIVLEGLQYFTKEQTVVQGRAVSMTWIKLIFHVHPEYAAGFIIHPVHRTVADITEVNL